MLLQRFPAADANGDGVLSEAEARAYYAKMRSAKPASPARAGIAPAPTQADVAYGPASRQVLDFWQAKSDRPTPVVVYIHGGGFLSGDKSKAREEKLVQQCLDAEVSFAAINYRFLAVEVPIQQVLRDCARAVQFIRSKSGDWNLDRARVAAYGSSAGAGASLWLGSHDDLAEPGHADPVRRESSRLVCAGVISGQYSYNIFRWQEVFGEAALQRFGGRYLLPEFAGLKSEADLRGTAGRAALADVDMDGLLSSDDAPVFVSAALPGLELENTNQFLHHPKHAQKIMERCRAVGVPVVAIIPALGVKPAAGEPATWRDFLFARLGVKSRASAK